MADIKPKIAALIPYPVYPAKMGGQKGIALFYRYLSEKIPVALIGVKGQQPDRESAPLFLGMLEKSRLRYVNIFIFFRLKRFLRIYNIGTLIIEHPYYGWLGWMLRKFAGIKIIFHSHNIESQRFKTTGKWWWKIMQSYEGWAHRYADFNFFITPEDKAWAISNYGIHPEKCTIIPYGCETKNRPEPEKKSDARKQLCAKYGLNGNEKLFLFNGTLNYKPNLDALNFILDRINPLLQQQRLAYRIFICGKGLPEKMGELKDYRLKSVIYAGFVEDINLYFLGTDIFLNPVSDGGGIKTKLVEALAENLTVVSSSNGAIGVPAEIAGEKLLLAEDDAPESYLKNIAAADPGTQTPALFFDYFYWGNIATKAVGHLSEFIKN